MSRTLVPPASEMSKSKPVSDSMVASCWSVEVDVVVPGVWICRVSLIRVAAMCILATGVVGDPEATSMSTVAEPLVPRSTAYSWLMPVTTVPLTLTIRA